MPMLTVVKTSLPSTITGSLSARWMRWARPTGSRRSSRPSQQHDELVAAETGHDVVGPQHADQALGRGEQQLVAGGVPERVVDDLEPVEVEEEQRHRPGRPVAPHQDAGQLVEQQGPVGQSGQRVVQRLVGQLGLGALQRGDVGGHGQDVVDPTVLGELGHGTGLEPLELAARPDLPLGVEPTAAVEDLADGPLPSGVVGHSEHVGRLGHHRTDVHVVGLREQRRAGVDQPEVAVEAGDERGRVLDQRAVALLAHPQLVLLAVAFGDVLDVGDRVAELARRRPAPPRCAGAPRWSRRRDAARAARARSARARPAPPERGSR